MSNNRSPNPAPDKTPPRPTTWSPGPSPEHGKVGGAGEQTEDDTPTTSPDPTPADVQGNLHAAQISSGSVLSAHEESQGLDNEPESSSSFAQGEQGLGSSLQTLQGVGVECESTPATSEQGRSHLDASVLPQKSQTLDNQPSTSVAVDPNANTSEELSSPQLQNPLESTADIFQPSSCAEAHPGLMTTSAISDDASVSDSTHSQQLRNVMTSSATSDDVKMVPADLAVYRTTSSEVSEMTSSGSSEESLQNFEDVGGSQSQRPRDVTTASEASDDTLTLTSDNTATLTDQFAGMKMSDDLTSDSAATPTGSFAVRRASKSSDDNLTSDNTATPVGRFAVRRVSETSDAVTLDSAVSPSERFVVAAVPETSTDVTLDSATSPTGRFVITKVSEAPADALTPSNAATPVDVVSSDDTKREVFIEDDKDGEDDEFIEFKVKHSVCHSSSETPSSAKSDDQKGGDDDDDHDDDDGGVQFQVGSKGDDDGDDDEDDNADGDIQFQVGSEGNNEDGHEDDDDDGGIHFQVGSEDEDDNDKAEDDGDAGIQFQLGSASDDDNTENPDDDPCNSTEPPAQSSGGLLSAEEGGQAGDDTEDKNASLTSEGNERAGDFAHQVSASQSMSALPGLRRAKSARRALHLKEHFDEEDKEDDREYAKGDDALASLSLVYGYGQTVYRGMRLRRNTWPSTERDNQHPPEEPKDHKLENTDSTRYENRYSPVRMLELQQCKERQKGEEELYTLIERDTPETSTGSSSEKTSENSSEKTSENSSEKSSDSSSEKHSDTSSEKDEHGAGSTSDKDNDGKDSHDDSEDSDDGGGGGGGCGCGGGSFGGGGGGGGGDGSGSSDKGRDGSDGSDGVHDTQHKDRGSAAPDSAHDSEAPMEHDKNSGASTNRSSHNDSAETEMPRERQEMETAVDFDSQALSTHANGEQSTERREDQDRKDPECIHDDKNCDTEETGETAEVNLLSHRAPTTQLRGGCSMAERVNDPPPESETGAQSHSHLLDTLSNTHLLSSDLDAIVEEHRMLQTQTSQEAEQESDESQERSKRVEAAEALLTLASSPTPSDDASREVREQREFQIQGSAPLSEVAESCASASSHMPTMDCQPSLRTAELPPATQQSQAKLNESEQIASETPPPTETPLPTPPVSVCELGAGDRPETTTYQKPPPESHPTLPPPPPPQPPQPPPPPPKGSSSEEDDSDEEDDDEDEDAFKAYYEVPDSISSGSPEETPGSPEESGLEGACAPASPSGSLDEAYFNLQLEAIARAEEEEANRKATADECDLEQDVFRSADSGTEGMEASEFTAGTLPFRRDCASPTAPSRRECAVPVGTAHSLLEGAIALPDYPPPGYSRLCQKAVEEVDTGSPQEPLGLSYQEKQPTEQNSDGTASKSQKQSEYDCEGRSDPESSEPTKRVQFQSSDRAKTPLRRHQSFHGSSDNSPPPPSGGDEVDDDRQLYFKFPEVSESPTKSKEEQSSLCTLSAPTCAPVDFPHTSSQPGHGESTPQTPQDADIPAGGEITEEEKEDIINNNSPIPPNLGTSERFPAGSSFSPVLVPISLPEAERASSALVTSAGQSGAQSDTLETSWATGFSEPASFVSESSSDMPVSGSTARCPPSPQLYPLDLSLRGRSGSESSTPGRTPSDANTSGASSSGYFTMNTPAPEARPKRHPSGSSSPFSSTPDRFSPRHNAHHRLPQNNPFCPRESSSEWSGNPVSPKAPSAHMSRGYIGTRLVKSKSHPSSRHRDLSEPEFSPVDTPIPSTPSSVPRTPGDVSLRPGSLSLVTFTPCSASSDSFASPAPRPSVSRNSPRAGASLTPTARNDANTSAKDTNTSLSSDVGSVFWTPSSLSNSFTSCNFTPGSAVSTDCKSTSVKDMSSDFDSSTAESALWTAMSSATENVQPASEITSPLPGPDVHESSTTDKPSDSSSSATAEGLPSAVLGEEESDACDLSVTYSYNSPYQYRSVASVTLSRSQNTEHPAPPRRILRITSSSQQGKAAESSQISQQGANPLPPCIPAQTFVSSMAIQMSSSSDPSSSSDNTQQNSSNSDTESSESSFCPLNEFSTTSSTHLPSSTPSALSEAAGAALQTAAAVAVSSQIPWNHVADSARRPSMQSKQDNSDASKQTPRKRKSNSSLFKQSPKQCKETGADSSQQSSKDTKQDTKDASKKSSKQSKRETDSSKQTSPSSGQRSASNGQSKPSKRGRGKFKRSPSKDKGTGP